MKINEELDAMYTIGMNPMEVLVLPRVIGLTISLPILTLIANLFRSCQQLISKFNIVKSKVSISDFLLRRRIFLYS